MNKKTKKLFKTLSSIILALIAALMFTWLWFLFQEAKRVETPTNESPIILFSTQTRDDVQKSYISAIQEAKKSILIAIFSITDPSVIAALYQKSLEGVDIKIICHDEGSYHLEKKIGPHVKILRRSGKGLMHLKILVVDLQKTFIGSANLTSASLKMYGNLVSAFDSSSLSLYVTNKILSMSEQQNENFFKSQNFNIGNQLVEVWFLPNNQKGSIRIKQLIRGAKRTIRVAMFTFTREDFAKELILASLKGVLVEVALDHSSSKGSSLKVFEMLNKTNINLLVNKGPGLLHYKFLTIDDEILVNGSANWTKNAFNTNDDCFIVIHDLTKKQINQMNKVWNAIIDDSISK